MRSKTMRAILGTGLTLALLAALSACQPAATPGPEPQPPPPATPAPGETGSGAGSEGGGTAEPPADASPASPGGGSGNEAGSSQPAPAASGIRLVETGRTVFTNRCARCHGARGQGLIGPQLIGANSALARYDTAQELFGFLSTAMPMDAPGSLSHDEYLQVLGFLLTENNYTAAAEYQTDGLHTIPLKR
ncbi:MAG: c-type cytochrome [Chloroflexi bacterium]|nr:c-type cytochrome [Chloroflexota bacterium]